MRVIHFLCGGVDYENIYMNIAFKICICYNASRQREVIIFSCQTNENPSAATLGFSIPIFGNGKA